MTIALSCAAARFRAATTSVSQWTLRWRHSLSCGRMRVWSFARLCGVRSNLLATAAGWTGSWAQVADGPRATTSATVIIRLDISVLLHRGSRKEWFLLRGGQGRRGAGAGPARTGWAAGHGSPTPTVELP